jgi:hypothetical protein
MFYSYFLLQTPGVNFNQYPPHFQNLPTDNWNHVTVKANSHIPCRSHAAPMTFPCHDVPLRVYIVSFPLDLYSAALFDSHMSCHAHTAPVPCHDHAVLKAPSPGHGTARHGHGMCKLASAAERRNMGDLPAFGFFRLPCGVLRRLFSEAYQSVKL